MTNDKRGSIRIELSDEQRKQIKAASGEDVSVLEFTAEMLEQRIVPGTVKWTSINLKQGITDA